MRTPTIILLTLAILRLSSQTVTPHDPLSTRTETVVGTSTQMVCHHMKSKCKSGKLLSNERTGIADTSVVFIDGSIVDMTGKKLAGTFFKFINQKTKESSVLVSDSTGRMRISGFDAGTYTLKLTTFGYQDLVIKDLKFGTGDIRYMIVDMGEYCCTDVETKREDHGYPPDHKKQEKKK